MNPIDESIYLSEGTATGVKRPAIEVLPVASGAVVDVLLPGILESDIDFHLDHDHLVVDGRSGAGPRYHLDLEIVSGTSQDQVRAVISDGKVSVLVPNPHHDSGCSFRPAA